MTNPKIALRTEARERRARLAAAFLNFPVALSAHADALAEAIHAIARVGPLSGDPYRLAGEIGMPPWKIQKAQKQSRRWSRETVATAIRLVAALNADVKGAAADADYVLESAVRRIAELASGGGR